MVNKKDKAKSEERENKIVKIITSKGFLEGLKKQKSLEKALEYFSLYGIDLDKNTLQLLIKLSNYKKENDEDKIDKKILEEEILEMITAGRLSDDSKRVLICGLAGAGLVGVLGAGIGLAVGMGSEYDIIEGKSKSKIGKSVAKGAAIGAGLGGMGGAVLSPFVMFTAVIANMKW